MQIYRTIFMCRDELFQENLASAITQIYLEFADTGTKTWFRKNVEWFLIYLITEIGTTPHNVRQGYSVPSLMDAYDAVVHELVSLSEPYRLSHNRIL